MKILMIFHASPYPPEIGPARRHFHVLCELIKHHEVSVLSFGDVEQRRGFLRQFHSALRDVVFIDNRLSRFVEVFARIFSMLVGRSAMRHRFTRRLQRELDLLVSRRRFDLIICSTPFLAHYRLPNSVPVISDTHNVEWLVMQRACDQTRSWWRKFYYFLQTRSTRREELAGLAKVSAVLTISKNDLQMFRADLPDQRFFLVPNGVAVSAYKVQQHQESRTLLFTGLMSYYANAHGINWFLDQVFPLIRAEVPEVRLIIAGARPSRNLRARQSDSISVTGYVPDIRPFLARAQIFIAPLHIGGGTRVKILEAMAMQRPVVATTLACEGLEVCHGVNVLLADRPRDFAAAVIRLLRDPEMRDSLARRGRKLVVERYDWPAIGVQLDTALREIAGTTETIQAVSFRGSMMDCMTSTVASTIEDTD